MAIFRSRPKSKELRLWLQFTMKDGNQFEGTVQNDMLALMNDIQFGAISYTAPSKKRQIIGVELLERIEVLGVINAERLKRYARA